MADSRISTEKTIRDLLRGLAFEQQEAEFKDVAEILYHMFASLIADQEDAFATKIVSAVKKLATSAKNPSVQNAMWMYRLYERLFSQTALAAIEQRIVHENALASEPLRILLSHLPKSKVVFLMQLLVKVEDAEGRQTICTLLKDLDRSDILPLVQMLESDDPLIAQQTLHYLGEHASKGGTLILYKLFQDKRPTVRLAVIHAVQVQNDNTTRAMLSRGLHDTDAGVRQAVLRIIMQRKERTYAPDIVALIKDGDFSDKPLDERRLTYLALATLAGDDVVDLFRDILWHNSHFSPRRAKEDQLIAVEALKQIDSESAKQTLADLKSKRFISRRLRDSL